MSKRIQFELEDEEWERISRYISTEKRRHDIGKEALFEWCTRREGRDKKLVTDRRLKDTSELKPIIMELLHDLGVI